ncbi:hypothetical protein BGX28_003139 [Mortierella sp. GBA30]|nr:hypothetical protein BGX28_003139 [Mortierella sp. GBA30]
MCQRTTCQDCGKFTWTGCGQHITEVLAGLPLEQICSCDDDRDSEHSWATLKNNITDSTITATTSAVPSGSIHRPLPRYPLPFSLSASTSTSSTSTTTAAADVTQIQPPTRTDPTGHCPDPSPVEYKLSKISSTSAEAAAVRMAQQAAALEELRRIKENKEKELKAANETALQRLLQGLSESTDEGC